MPPGLSLLYRVARASSAQLPSWKEPDRWFSNTSKTVLLGSKFPICFFATALTPWKRAFLAAFFSGLLGQALHTFWAPQKYEHCSSVAERMKKKAVDGCDVNGTFHTRFKATLSLNLGLDTRRKQVHALFGGMPIHPSFQMTPTSYSSGEVSSIQLLVMRGTKKRRYH